MRFAYSLTSLALLASCALLPSASASPIEKRDSQCTAAKPHTLCSPAPGEGVKLTRGANSQTKFSYQAAAGTDVITVDLYKVDGSLKYYLSGAYTFEHKGWNVTDGATTFNYQFNLPDWLPTGQYTFQVYEHDTSTNSSQYNYFEPYFVV